MTHTGQVVGQDVGTILDHWARVKPDHPFLVWAPREGGGRSWTYAQFRADVRRLAAGLSVQGINKGDHVLLHSDNCPEMVLAWYACAVIGAVGVTTNTRSVEAELSFLVTKTQCVAAVTQPHYAQLVRAAGPALSWVAVIDGGAGDTPFDSLYGDEAACPDREVEPMLAVGILFTSGTTSKPKAVVHTHANVVWAGRVGPRNIDLSGDDVYFTYLPLFHINAQSWCFWNVLGVGATVVLSPKWSTSTFWDTIVTYQVTHMSLMTFCFPALFASDQPDTHKLRALSFAQMVPELDAMLGMRIYGMFGMTETVTHAISARPQDGWPRTSMGHPTPGYAMAVMDEETLAPVAEGKTGELWLRGERGVQLFLEYFDNSEATAAAFTQDGWFRTGDRVSLLEGGNVVYADRHSDLIKVGGENVSALEVEEAIRNLADVCEVAVVARTHAWLDMVVVAFVIPMPGAGADLERTVIDACAQVLADFKVPRAVYLVEEFPRATLEKVAKNQLRTLAEQMPPIGEAARPSHAMLADTAASAQS